MLLTQLSHSAAHSAQPKCCSAQLSANYRLTANMKPPQRKQESMATGYIERLQMATVGHDFCNDDVRGVVGIWSAAASFTSGQASLPGSADGGVD